MIHEPTPTIRARRLRERRSRGIVITAPVEVGKGGVAILVGNGLLEELETRDRNAVGAMVDRLTHIGGLALEVPQQGEAGCCKQLECPYQTKFRQRAG